MNKSIEIIELRQVIERLEETISFKNKVIQKLALKNCDLTEESKKKDELIKQLEKNLKQNLDAQVEERNEIYTQSYFYLI